MCFLPRFNGHVVNAAFRLALTVALLRYLYLVAHAVFIVIEADNARAAFRTLIGLDIENKLLNVSCICFAGMVGGIF